jgi:3-dehydroquinate dehydratase-2
MLKILVLHGNGMEMRGKTQIEIFGPMTLPEYDEHIRRYALDLSVEVEIFHSNIEKEVIQKLADAPALGFHAAILNPGGYSKGYPALVAAVSRAPFPTIEVHISNPARRGIISDFGAVARGVVAGFGVSGYYIALKGLKEIV